MPVTLFGLARDLAVRSLFFALAEKEDRFLEACEEERLLFLNASDDQLEEYAAAAVRHDPHFRTFETQLEHARCQRAWARDPELWIQKRRESFADDDDAGVQE